MRARGRTCGADRCEGLPSAGPPTAAPAPPCRDATKAERPLRSGAGRRLPDPAAMPPAARLAELGGLFAIGFRRSLVSSQNSLAEIGQVEAECMEMDAHEEAPPEARP